MLEFSLNVTLVIRLLNKKYNKNTGLIIWETRIGTNYNAYNPSLISSA
jgi:hypothetical protein